LGAKAGRAALAAVDPLSRANPEPLRRPLHLLANTATNPLQLLGQRGVQFLQFLVGFGQLLSLLWDIVRLRLAMTRRSLM
jgi:hypothetical protein